MRAGHQPLAVGERLALASRFFRISFNPLYPNIVAELHDETGHVVQTAPAVALGGVTTCAFDLARVRAGAGYTAFLRQGAAKQQIGFDAVRQRGAPPGEQLAATTFLNEGRERHVTLSVEPGTRAVSLSIDVAAARAVGPFPRYSVVAPVYNVAAYLDDFFASLAAQTVGFRENIEVVAVDDGSLDGSYAILARWRAAFPDNIVILRKKNGGAASARNAGLAVARGAWLAFMDPDDFLSPGYFAEVDGALQRVATAVMVACRVVYFHEAAAVVDDGHPLRFRFSDGAVETRRIGALGSAVQATVNNAVISAERLRAIGLKFDERLAYGFEDTHLLARFLARNPEDDIAYAKRAIYLYRRRSDGSAVTNDLMARPSTYVERIHFGHLGLLQDAAALGPVPAHLQHLVLYSLSWLVNHVLADGPAVSALLGTEREARHLTLVRDVLGYIDPAVIASHDLSGVPFLYAVGLLAFKDMDPPFQVVGPCGWDAAAGALTVRAWSRHRGRRVALIADGAPCEVAHTTEKELRYLSWPFVWESTTSVKVPAAARGISIQIEGADALWSLGGVRHSGRVTIEDFNRALGRQHSHESRSTG